MEIKIEPCDFQGTEALEIQTEKARLVAAVGIGPRIAHFGKSNGRNLLFWDAKEELRRGDWRLRGGHRIWTTRPGADESEESYALDNLPVVYELFPTSVRLTSPQDRFTGLQKQLTIQCESATRFRIISTIINISDMLWSGGVWSITATDSANGSVYGIPLGDGSNWDIVRIVIPRRWGGHSARVDDPQVALTENCMIVRPECIESKRMVLAPKGIIGMTDASENVSFIKNTNFQPSSIYPEGTNVAFYIAPNSLMVEMEFMGPQITMKPGAELSLAETWSLEEPINWENL